MSDAKEYLGNCLLQLIFTCTLYTYYTCSLERIFYSRERREKIENGGIVINGRRGLLERPWINGDQSTGVVDRLLADFKP
jgi:hypothetical protein